MKIEIKLKLHGITPSKAHAEDAGFDIFSAESKIIPASNMCIVNTGLFINIPVGYVGLLCSRSGMGKRGIRLSNCVGVIDAGYHGEVGVMMHNDSTLDYYIDAGNKIAQLLILPIADITLSHVSDFNTKSTRGENGFGSTN
jgi:dUTP pyrophosphatase